ncbi:MAG TPA: 4-hydroxy-tetrahydrodipicolinate synthase [Acidobacteriaceae bacterium]|nr:4-hydroxy-tetrahydrodipicolinate synthase [Acidobacteriaceae bacterium]
MNFEAPIGCGTALVTPMRADGSVDETALAAFVDWQVTSGINLLIPCGTTGEASTLTETEWLRVIEITIEAAAGRAAIFGGCTHNSTAVAVERATRLSKLHGLSGILTASPYYNRPSQEGQFQHFKAIAGAAPLPILLYNIPGRTGVNIDPATVLRLANACPNIVGIKESSGNLAQIAECITQAQKNFRVYAGDDSVALDVIELGGAGLISVASNEVPAEMADMVSAALAKNWPKARGLNQRYAQLMKANFVEPSPAPAKAVLSMMGRMSETVRLPIVPVTVGLRENLTAIAVELGLLKTASV